MPTQTISAPQTVKVRYVGPKPNKHLDLPVGIVAKGDIEHSVVFTAINGGCADVPAQYVEALLALSDQFEYADDAARHALASWMTDPSPVDPPSPAPRAASYDPIPDVVSQSVNRSVPTPSKKLELLTTFEELL